jgi:hypothetical protein
MSRATPSGKPCRDAAGKFCLRSATSTSQSIVDALGKSCLIGKFCPADVAAVVGSALRESLHFNGDFKRMLVDLADNKRIQRARRDGRYRG